MNHKKWFNDHFKEALVLDVLSNLSQKGVLLLMAYTLGLMVDQIQSGETHVIRAHFGTFVVLMLVLIVVLPFLGWMSDKYYVKNGFDYENSLFECLMKGSFEVRLKMGSGEIVDRFLEDTNDYKIFRFNAISHRLIYGVILIGGSIYLLLLNRSLALVVLILLLLFTGVYWPFKKKQASLTKDLNHNKSILFDEESALVEAYETTRVWGIEKKVLKTLDKRISRYLYWYEKSSVMGILLEACQSLVEGLFPLIVTLIGLKQIERGQLTFAELAQMLLIVSWLTESTIMLNRAIGDRAKSKQIEKRLEDLIREPEQQGTCELEAVDRIVFDSIDYTYPKGQGNQCDQKPVFKDFSRIFSGAQRYDIHEENGWGKTSLMRLLTGLCTPQKGRILINDYPLDHWSLSSLRGQISLVSQESLLFNQSVKDNIILESTYDPKEYNRLIKGLGIESLQYRRVTNQGDQLSAGEKHKIALARILLNPRSVMIFDEPFNHLDSESITFFNQCIDNLKGMRIVISHANMK